MTVAAQARLDNRLSFTDQLLFLGQRATGQELVMQCVWVYEHPVDLDGIRRLHENVGYGLYGRLIERSPLPFGRHRWVSAPGAKSSLDIVETPVPREELSDWIDERAQLPIDPETGPSWHLGVLPMTDGSTAVSMVGSHCLADGFGGLLTIVDGIIGNRRDLGYPPPRSRPTLQAATADLKETVRGLPEVARTLVRVGKQAVRRRHEIKRSTGPRAAVAAENMTENVVVPAITIYIDVDDWDVRANALNGTSHSLVAAFAAKLAERLERHRPDGGVTLHIPISDRVADDTRANAASIATVVIDPTSVTTDLSAARREIKRALTTMREEPDENLELLPLTPFIPKRAVKRGSDVVFNFADMPVSCSILGDIDSIVARADGTESEYVMLRGVDRQVSRGYLEHRGGMLTVLAGRICGKVSITVVAYQSGEENSKPRLRELAAKVLAEFELTGVID